jgi:hypothetical protein
MVAAFGSARTFVFVGNKNVHSCGVLHKQYVRNAKYVPHEIWTVMPVRGSGSSRGNTKKRQSMFGALEFWVWVATALLVAGYGLAGLMKGFGSVENVQSSMAWAKTSSPALIRFIGAVEVAGAIGLVLPVLTGILPWLTPLAAAGLALIQLLAIPVHVRVGDIKQSWPINLAFLGLSLFVLWARSGLFHS